MQRYYIAGLVKTESTCFDKHFAYYVLFTGGHNGLDTLANCNKVELDKL